MHPTMPLFHPSWLNQEELLAGMRTEHRQAILFAKSFEISWLHTIEFSVPITCRFNKCVSHFRQLLQ